MSLDSVLNIVVPWAIFIFLGILIYSKAKKPIDTFFGKIRDWIKDLLEEKEVDVSSEEYSIRYLGADI
jgi:hypothetical protein